MRISYDTLVKEFKRILISRGVNEKNAQDAAENFAQTSLDGIYSHGVNRFPRIISYLDRGVIDPNAEPEVEMKSGAMERWNGKLGLGNLNARKGIHRACDLAEENGIGIVAIRNTNHWLRGGAFAWEAADRGFISICWTNTMPNMPAYGAKDRRIGNNPFIMGVPRSSGEHVVIDMALSQFSYGKIEEHRIKGQPLPVPGGYDSQGEITTDASEIEKTWRVLPVGFWKGSGLSIVLDMVAAILSGGNSVSEIGKNIGDEVALSQVMIAIDSKKFGSLIESDAIVDRIIEDLKHSDPVDPNRGVSYPGESTVKRRKENLESGIPVMDEIWNTIKSL